MKCMPLYLILVLAAGTLGLWAEERPKITGVDHVEFFTTAPEANRNLYVTVLGLREAPPLEAEEIQRFLVGAQWIGYRRATDGSTNERIDHVAFTTDDCQALHTYLAAKGFDPRPMGELKDGSRWFRLKDPDGHSIEFRQPSKATSAAEGDAISRRIIHAGFIVRDRAAEDHLYRDTLAFRPYWHGGMQPGRTDWLAIQAPDGHEWLEYMLNVPSVPDMRMRGVLNHVSLGVRDMKAAQAKLEAHGWKPHGNEQAKIGKDGKWQLNLYDPDLTRLELMEFTPVEKPCCSEFEAPHPEER